MTQFFSIKLLRKNYNNQIFFSASCAKKFTFYVEILKKGSLGVHCSEIGVIGCKICIKRGDIIKADGFG